MWFCFRDQVFRFYIYGCVWEGLVFKTGYEEVLFFGTFFIYKMLSQRLLQILIIWKISFCEVVMCISVNNLILIKKNIYMNLIVSCLLWIYCKEEFSFPVQKLVCKQPPLLSNFACWNNVTLVDSLKSAAVINSSQVLM